MLAAGLGVGVAAGGGAGGGGAGGGGPAITTVVTLGETGSPAAAAPVVTAGPHGRAVTR